MTVGLTLTHTHTHSDIHRLVWGGLCLPHFTLWPVGNSWDHDLHPKNPTHRRRCDSTFLFILLTFIIIHWSVRTHSTNYSYYEHTAQRTLSSTLTATISSLSDCHTHQTHTHTHIYRADNKNVSRQSSRSEHPPRHCTQLHMQIKDVNCFKCMCRLCRWGESDIY